ncbi:MAG: orotate phosphoribosyltransferase, partial [Candidatus Aenigmarchaeota archaeon]|nr:orotate phosphoribosyltransferase [Candidatus Aenigmarchaeota archaeon]
MRFEGKDKGIAMELLRVLKKAVKRGTFILASGKKSDFYINVKEVYCNPEAARLMGKKLALALKKSRAKRIAGLELGAVPLVV